MNPRTTYLTALYAFAAWICIRGIRLGGASWFVSVVGGAFFGAVAFVVALLIVGLIWRDNEQKRPPTNQHQDAS